MGAVAISSRLVRQPCVHTLSRDHLIDAVIPEAEGGIQKNMHPTVDVLDRMLCRELKRLCSLPEEVLLEERYQKYRYAEGEMRPV